MAAALADPQDVANQVAAQALADLHTVFGVCAVTDEAVRTRIFNNEGFTEIATLRVLESDSEVDHMAKRLQVRTVAEGRVNLTTVQIQYIKALAWWVRDRIKHGQPLTAADFTPAARDGAMESKRVEKERVSTEVSIKDLSKFDPDDFDIHEDAFLNLLSRTYGAMKVSLRYVVRSEVVPTEYADDEERRMFQLPLQGVSYDQDNRDVYRKLKAFLVDTPGWAWIEPFNNTENGRGAFWAWANHYNGRGELSKRTEAAKQRLETLHYKNERSMSFEKYTELMTKAFATLDKDDQESLTERQKVSKLLKGINTPDVELTGSKAVVAQNFPEDFSGACAYFSAQVSRIHGAAQLESRRYRKRNVSQLETGRGASRGRGRGRFGGRGQGRYGRGGRGGRFGGRGGGGRGRSNMINGVDVSDPTRNFTTQEWNDLTWNGGIAYVMQARERMGREGRGRGRGRGRDDGRGGGRDGQRNTSALHSDTPDQQHSNNDGNTNTGQGNERGAQHGRRFGRGAYSS